MEYITQDAFQKLHSLKPKRIYLPDFDYLKQGSGGYAGTLNFPFTETIKKLFEEETELQLFPSKYGIWRSIREPQEYTNIQEWLESHGSTVFIRSLLSLCLALDLNVIHAKSEKTPVGHLEYKAKNKQDPQAIEHLTELTCKKIRNTSFYKDAHLIASVPVDKNKDFNLPRRITDAVAKKLNLRNISDSITFQEMKPAIKNLSVSEKWNALDSARLKIDFKGTPQPIILFDDKYQSGTTMHYIASCLQQMGFDKIYGFVLVKTLKDDDNQ